MDLLKQLSLNYKLLHQLGREKYKLLRKLTLEKYESFRQVGLKKYLPYYDVRTKEEYDQELKDSEHWMDSCLTKEKESFCKHRKLVFRRICRISFDGDEFSIESNPK
jgi:hypothetical protein